MILFEAFGWLLLGYAMSGAFRRWREEPFWHTFVPMFISLVLIAVGGVLSGKYN